MKSETKLAGSLSYSLLLVASLLAVNTTVFADDPARHSLSAEYGPTAPNILWQGSLSSIIAQQAVIEGNVAVMPRISDVLHGTRIVAHNLLTGDTLWTVDLPVDFPAQPRMAIGADGIIYVTNGGFANGALYSFNPDLSLRWSTPIVNVGGPAIGEGGTLIVCGVGTDVRAYEGGTGVTEHSIDRSWQGYLEVSPNPFRHTTNIIFAIPEVDIQQNTVARLNIYDSTGRLVVSFDQVSSIQNQKSIFVWDGRDNDGRQVSYGVYFVTLMSGAHRATQKVMFIK